MIKIITAIIALLLCCFHMNCQDLITSSIEQKGNTIDFNDVIYGSDTLSFSLVNENLTGKWNISVLSDTNIYIDLSSMKTEANGKCLFKPTPGALFRKAKRIYKPHLNQDLFRIKVTFESTDGYKDSKYFDIALLPSRPIIYDVIFKYVYDWEYDDIYPNGDFSFNVTSDNGILYLELHGTDSFLFQKNNKLFFSWVMALDNIEERIRYNADWGEFLCVGATNYFGSVHSDTICTTSYITDIDILKRIECLENKSGIDINEFNQPQNIELRINNNQLIFSEVVEHIHVYNMAGALLIKRDNTSHIDISALSIGIYLISYENSGKIRKQKIIKK